MIKLAPKFSEPLSLLPIQYFVSSYPVSAVVAITSSLYSSDSTPEAPGSETKNFATHSTASTIGILPTHSKSHKVCS